MRILWPLLFIAVLFSCTNQHSPSLLNREALSKQTFRINTTRDTVVKTAGGALLEIKKGSLSGSGDVELEVKEAYSFDDIIKAGLTTQSNGQPLSSGGMIFISAVDKKVAIAKPIRISLPTDQYDVEMKLFKGEEKDGALNWDTPKILSDSLSPYLTAGKNFFTANCATCHAYEGTQSGPAMKGLESRGPWKNRMELYAFTHNPADYIAHNCYAKDLMARFGGQIMPAYPQLDITALNAVYDYIRNEDLRRNVDLTNDYVANPCEDSCRRYDSVRYAVQERLSNLAFRQQELSGSQEERIAYSNIDTTVRPLTNAVNNTTPSTQQTPAFVTPPTVKRVELSTYEARYYSFEITSFGWYNIDKLLKLTRTDAVLFLTVDNSLSNEINVFLAVPKEKVFLRGGKLADSVSYGFDQADGKLPLPIGEKVTVFALSEKGDKILFDYKEFISTSDNRITLVPREMTKGMLDENVKRLSLSGVTIQAKESKREQARKIGEEIKHQENDLEKWRPKSCNCNCFETKDSTVVPMPLLTLLRWHPKNNFLDSKHKEAIAFFVP